MADGRLFRLTYDSGTVRYGERAVAGPAAAQTLKHGSSNYRLGLVTKIEATDLAATKGWTDVSGEFGIGA